jgi:hypothetical protein
VTNAEPPDARSEDDPNDVGSSDAVADADRTAGTRTPAPKKLPEANEFSPGQVSVRKLLEIVQGATGDRDTIIEGVRAEFFADAAQARTDPEKRMQQQRTRAYNAVLGASKYGLVDAGLTG